jgi:hypothetical protein
MCKEIEDNRRLLSKLVFSKKSFTADEIIHDYKAQRGNAIIDGFESVRGFLRGLEDNGSLRLERGKYVVVD